MLCKEHGFTISLLWKISPLLTIIGIIGIFTLTPGLWKTISWVLLGIGVSSLFFSLYLVFPYKKWKQDTDKMSFAYKIQVAQENNPVQFIAIEPHTLFIKGDEQNRRIIGIQATIHSALLKPVNIRQVIGIIRIPVNREDYVIDVDIQFHSREGDTKQLMGVATGLRATYGDIYLDCERNNDIPCTIQVDRWLRVEGQAVITSDIFSDSRLDFASSVYLVEG